ncbi:MAG: hypothetical protein OSJ74_06290, partial [Clostridia bacterium]|nr:hypothetical protein [Clostridia bacterium]
MNIIRKKTGLIYLSICIALTVLIFLSCAIPQSINLQSRDKVAQAATVGAGTASVLNLNEKGEAQDYFSNVITGGQNEYIYIGGNISSTTANTPGYLNSGANAHTGAIKWRVLSVTDTKYNSAGGTWLLWADYMLGSGFYNPHYKNPYYAFWGNSMIRAKLNGGNYLSTVSSISSIPNLNQTVNPENSWVYNLFNIDERASFVRATDYETWNYLDLGLGTSTRECKILTNDARMVGANYYSSAFLTRVNDRGANVSVVDNTSVKEVYSGDYLFFIDFDDINNVSFGFGDSGVTYAKKVDSTWVSSQLSGYYGDGDITVSYLKEQTDIARDYWLRPAGIWGGTQKHSATVGVNTLNGCGTLPYTDDENGNIGVRPAFNFSPANVLYATASDTTSISDTFAPVSVINGGKPAYKLYLKNSGYKNYSVGTYADADMPKLTTGGSNVSVKMTGQSGSAVFLLADSSGNGEVKYQATANFNNGVATATLPSGVKASDYTVTVLFLDGNARGGEYAETVTASYTGLTVPEDESAAATQYYSGGNYEFKLSHVDDDLLDISLTYLGLNGVTDLPTSATATVSNGIYMLTAKEVGKYTVKIKPKSGRYWVNGTTAEKEYVFYIKYKVAELEVTGGSANAVKPYNGSEQSFALSNYDSDKMNVNTNAVDDLTFDGTASPPVFKATKAKKYDVDVELKDTTLMEWSGGGVLKKTVSVEIAKKKVKKPALSDPSATSKDYISQSSAVTFALTNYTGGSDVTITAPLSPLGASVDGANLKMLNAGTYSYRVELTDKDNTEWDDTAGGSLGYDITVTVNKKKIDKPEVSGDTSKEYTGSDVSFPLLKYTAGGDVTITAPTSPASASVDGTNLKASAVGIYNFTVSLTDTANTEWSNNGGTAPYTLTVSIGSGQIAKPSLDNAVLKLTDSKTYAQTGVTFTVYHTSSAVTITAPVTDPVGTASISGNTITVAQAGTYAFTVALTDSTNTEWVGGGKDSYTLTVTVDRMEISAPTFAPGADKKTYNGNIQTFPLTVDAAIEIRDSQQNVVTSFEAKDADTYNYTLHLKDTKNTQWQGANGDVSPKNISITIEKKTVNITSFTCSVSGNTPSWEKGESGVTFTVVEDSLTGDSVKLSLYIERGGNKSYDFAGVDESVAKTVTVTMPDYLTQGSYILGIELAAESPSNSNVNYVLTTLQSQIRKTFVVKGQGLILTEENMPWVYKYTDENQIENIVPI